MNPRRFRIGDTVAVRRRAVFKPHEEYNWQIDLDGKIYPLPPVEEIDRVTVTAENIDELQAEVDE